MITTKQARKIMKDGGRDSAFIWTNKPSKQCGTVRHVKCYKPDDYKVRKDLLKVLRTAAGAENVWETAGSKYISRRRNDGAIIVRCTLA